jgi:ferredoxin
MRGLSYAEDVTYIIAAPCIDLKDKSCVDVCPVDCIHEANRILVIDPEECIDCGACEPECPVEAIFPEDALPDKWAPFVRINYAYSDGLDTVDRLVDEWRSENDEGGSGVREPLRPPPDAPPDAQALDLD